MKLLLFTSETYPTYGGDGLSAYRFANSMGEYCETSIISYSRNSSLNEFDKANGVKIFRARYSGTSYISKIISRVKLLNLAKQIGKSYKVWVIYGLFPGAALVVMLAKAWGCKIIYRPTLSNFDTIKKENLRRISLRIIYLLADGFFIRNSKMFSDCYRNNKPIFQSSQGVQIERFRKKEGLRAEARKRFNIPESAIVVLMVGHLSSRKGFPQIADWINNLEDKPLLVHVGEKHDVNIKKQVRKILGNRFISFPATHQIEEYYWLSDLFVMASYIEGFPSNTILEAMASSLPIMCKRIEGYEDYLIDGHNAVLFDNEIEFRRGYEKIISNKSFSTNILENALYEVISRHNIETVSLQFMDFLNTHFSRLKPL